MEALLLVQLNTAPGTLLTRLMLIPAPWQKDWFNTAVTTGSGLTVNVMFCDDPVQPDALIAVTL
jgi:hypothetical protein